MTNLNLLFTHASLDTFMSDAKNIEDVEKLVHDETRMWITLTETSDAGTFKRIKRVVGKRYHAINPDNGDIAFLVRSDIAIKGYGGPLAIPAVGGSAAQGAHAARHNSWVHMRIGNENIFHTGVHFVVAHPDGAPHMNRRPQQLKQAQMMGVQMDKFGAGTNLATGSGDLNASIPFDKDLQAIFDRHGLTTTAAETKNTDSTHGDSRIDYAWTRDADTRLVVTKMKVYKAGFNSDHNPMDIFAKVTPAKKK